jgi:ubiquinone/menaquinone biosynthesis C-methylase UbiE
MTPAGPSCAACTGPLEPLQRIGEYWPARCVACGTVEVGGAGAIEYGADYYRDNYLAHAEQRLRFLTSLLGGLAPGGTLVDAGCGAGLALTAGRRAGWEALGCDSSPAAVEIARERGENAVLGDAASLPFADASAQAVLLLDVLAHVDHPSACVAEAARVVQPGGSVLVKTPRRPVWAYRVCAILPGRLGTSLAHLPAQRRAFSAEGLRRLLATAGFEEIAIEPSPEAVRPRELAQRRPALVAAGRLAD